MTELQKISMDGPLSWFRIDSTAPSAKKLPVSLCMYGQIWSKK